LKFLRAVGSAQRRQKSQIVAGANSALRHRTTPSLEGRLVMQGDRKKLSRRDLFKLGAGAGAAAFLGGVPNVLRAAGEVSPTAALPQVPRRKLGKTGQTVPILLMGGAMKLDPKFDPKLAECARFGVDYIDAADCYSGGTCEAAVGSYLAKMGDRKKVWITSKSDEHDSQGFESVLGNSLKALGTDYIDLYFLHALTDGRNLNAEMASTVERLKKEGKIHHFGFSCHDANVAELLQQAAKTPWVDAVMFRYNFRTYGDKELNAAMDACAKANVGLIAMKTQGSEASFADSWQKFQKVGKWSKQQAVLKAVWADERISAAVSHMDTFEKLKQNIAGRDRQVRLGQAEWNALEHYAAETRSTWPATAVSTCAAPRSMRPVRIGTTMRALMYHDAYGEPERARATFAKLPAEARQLSGIDFTAANAVCPNGIDIAAHMRRAAEVFGTA
jgi:predicted aldo/keto reductase-like oxidoreductase